MLAHPVTKIMGARTKRRIDEALDLVFITNSIPGGSIVEGPASLSVSSACRARLAEATFPQLKMAVYLTQRRKLRESGVDALLSLGTSGYTD